MQVINFESAKRKYIPDELFVGDVVEWKDYTGEVFEARITRISFRDSNMKDPISAPLWDLDDYNIDFEDGLSIAASCITRKLTGVITRPLRTLYVVEGDYGKGGFLS